MPSSPAPYPADLLTRAMPVKLVCFDVDGTLTDGTLFYDHQGHELKGFHVHDGLGIKLLQAAGIEVALVTARHSPATQARARDLGIAAHTQVQDKLACVRALTERLDLTASGQAQDPASLDAVAFMGDDLADLSVLRAVGLAVAPSNAHPWTARHTHWQTRLPGGAGAARELCDLILTAQGKADHWLPGVIGKGAQA